MNNLTLHIGEVLILSRAEVQLEAFIDNRKIVQKGCVFLTNKRLIHESDKEEEILFELLLENIEEEEFVQPIFRANFLTGMALPTENVANKIRWTLSFYNGTSTFINCFFIALKQSRTSKHSVSNLSLIHI